MSEKSTIQKKAPHYVVKKHITIKASHDKVWDALTNPELTKKYFYGCKVVSTWKPGSKISFKRKFLWIKFELKGKIVKIEPGKFLQYTLVNSSGDGENDNNQSTVTDELVYENGKTILSITDDMGNAEGAKKRYDKSVKGWDKILKGLKKVVEEPDL